MSADDAAGRVGNSDDVARSQWARLAADARAWLPGAPDALEAADRMEARLRELPSVRRLEGDAAALARLRRHLTASPDRWRGDLFDDQGPFEEAWWPVLAPFSRPRPEPTPWAYQRPRSISDEVGIRWCLFLGRHGGSSPDVIDFLGTFFAARRRDVWMPASWALARIAARDPAAVAEVARRWAAAFPEGLPSSWPKAGLGKNAHERRHALHLACAFVSAGGGTSHISGFSVSGFCRLAPPADPADASACFGSLRALLEGESTRAEALPALPLWLQKLDPQKLEEQIEAELRAVADLEVVDAPAQAAIVALLVAPKCVSDGSSHGARVVQAADHLLSAIATAQWLRSRGRDDDLERVRNSLGEGGGSIDLALGEPPPAGRALAMLLDRLPVVLDEHVFHTTPPSECAGALVEVARLLECPAVSDVPWRSAVARALESDAALQAPSGSAGEVGRAEIVARVAQWTRTAPAGLLRHAELTPDVVLRLCSHRNRFIENQAAIQLERLLRASSTPRAQVALLWRVLQRRTAAGAPEGDRGRGRPAADHLFERVHEDLRGSETKLHRVVSKIRALDACAPDTDGVLPAFSDVISATVALLDTDADADARGALNSFARDLLEIASADSPPAAMAAFRRAFVEPDAGIFGWADVLEIPRVELDDLPASFVRAVEAVADGADEGERRELVRATDAMKDVAGRLAWPERFVVLRFLAGVIPWADEHLVAARRVDRIVIDADEEAARGLVGEPRVLSLLSSAKLRSLHAFLLRHLLFREASALAKAAGPRASLPSLLAHQLPLLLGVMSGPAWVLDIGSVWNELAVGGREGAYSCVVLGCLAAGFLLAALDLLRDARPANGARRTRWLGRLAVRVLPWFAGYCLASLAITSLVLVSLRDTSIAAGPDGPIPLGRQTLLWSSLSLFLGLFMGRLITDRGFKDKEES